MKKIFLFLSIVLITSITLFAQKQKKIYYDQDWKGCSKSKAEFYRIVKYDKNQKPIGKIIDYFITGEVQAEIEGALYIDKVDDSKSKLIGLSTGFYKSGEKKSEIFRDNQGVIVTSKSWYQNGQLRRYKEYQDGNLYGKRKEWYEDGQIQLDIDYKNGKIDGKLLSYWNNGNAKRIDEFENGELISGKCFNIDGEEIPYFDYEILPSFKGGEVGLAQFISKIIIYPEKARDREFEGQVLVGFVVNTDGTISDVKIIKSVYIELDNEAIRVVKAMPRWTPGMIDGETVKTYFVLPVRFSIK
jgi:TonB family protein